MSNVTRLVTRVASSSSRHLVVELELMAGTSIEHALSFAKDKACRLTLAERVACALLGAQKVVQFVHQCVLVKVTSDSNLFELEQEWSKVRFFAQTKRKDIGP